MMFLLFLACKEPEAPATCTLLTINDTYQIEATEGKGGFGRVRSLRAKLEKEDNTILLHAGDFLGPSFPSRAYKGEQMIDIFNHLDGNNTAMDDKMFVVFGNHEFDSSKMADAAGLQARIDQSQFRWLGSSVQFKAGPDGKPLVSSPNLTDAALLQCGNLKIGLYGITTNSKKAEYIEKFRDPVEVAQLHTQGLKAQGAQFVVALTHQTVQQDRDLIEKLGDLAPDLIIGGHEHQRQDVSVNGRRILKADADAHSAWEVNLTQTDGKKLLEAEIIDLDDKIPEDAAVNAAVETWETRFDKEWCEKKEMLPGCLAAMVGKAATMLVAEELQIRQYETNLGDWIADLARASIPGSQLAFVNSGSLRLNLNIPEGIIRRSDIETLFAYPSPLVQLRVSGAVVEQMLHRSIEDWSGNGHWLQVSGVAFAHDPTLGQVNRITLLSEKRLMQASDSFLVVVPKFLVDPSGGQDGYTMLTQDMVVAEGPDLKDLVYAALRQAGDGGIAPQREGRICNQLEKLPCLAVVPGAP